MTVQDFIISLGGSTKVAEALGLQMTTVASWVHRNSVPQWRIGDLAKLAASKGKPLPGTFGPPIRRAKTRRAA